MEQERPCSDHFTLTHGHLERSSLCPLCLCGESWHYERVAGFEQDVLLQFLARRELLVVEPELSLLSSFPPHDHDVLVVRPLGKPAGGGKGLHHRHAGSQRIRAGTRELPDGVDHLAAAFLDDDRHLRGGDEVLELVRDGFLELRGRLALGRDFTDEGIGDLAVRHDGHVTGQVRFLPDEDVEDVVRPDLVGAVCRRLRHGGAGETTSPRRMTRRITFEYDLAVISQPPSTSISPQRLRDHREYRDTDNTIH